MTLPLGLPHKKSEQQQEIREARRWLKEHVRNDWHYPPLPRFQIPVAKEGEETARTEEGDEEEPGRNDRAGDDEGAEPTVAGFRFYHQGKQEREALLHRSPEQLTFSPAEWRERVYSSEESSEPDDTDVDGGGVTGPKKTPYKFENPNSIGEHLSDRREARKRRRKALLDEESTWNDGLAHWLARRDVWCAAHTSEQVKTMQREQEDRQRGSSSVSVSASASASASISSSVRISTDSSGTDGIVVADEAPSTPATTPELPLDPPTRLSVEAPVIPTQPIVPPSDVLVPLGPPFLADHPIRKRINPDLYPEIYSKIIQQSRSPSVPINLATMTRALVQGWKDDGEWPPKPTAYVYADKKHAGGESSLKHGVKAVGRALGITSGSSGVVASAKS